MNEANSSVARAMIVERLNNRPSWFLVRFTPNAMSDRLIWFAQKYRYVVPYAAVFQLLSNDATNRISIDSRSSP